MGVTFLSADVCDPSIGAINTSPASLPTKAKSPKPSVTLEQSPREEMETGNGEAESEGGKASCIFNVGSSRFLESNSQRSPSLLAVIKEDLFRLDME